METLSRETVAHIAHLSRLELSNDELDHFTTQLGAILKYASQLPELPPQSVQRAMTVQDDVSRDFPDPHALLINAKEVVDGYVKVPAILDRGDA